MAAIHPKLGVLAPKFGGYTLVSCNPTQRHIRHHDKRKNHQFN